MNDIRKLMESLDAIANESDEQSIADDNSQASYDDVVGHLKDITTAIISVLDKLQSGDADMDKVCEDLTKVSDILSGLAYNDSTSPAEGSEEKVEEDIGVEGDEPSTDSQGHRSYVQKSAANFPAQHGFTG